MQCIPGKIIYSLIPIYIVPFNTEMRRMIIFLEAILNANVGNYFRAVSGMGVCDG